MSFFFDSGMVSHGSHLYFKRFHQKLNFYKKGSKRAKTLRLLECYHWSRQEHQATGCTACIVSVILELI